MRINTSSTLATLVCLTAMGVFTPGASAQTYENAVSRELILQNGLYDVPEYDDVTSREWTILIDQPFFAENVTSREWVIANEPIEGFAADNVVSREWVIANEPATLTIVDVASREVVVHSNAWRSIRTHSGIGEIPLALNSVATGNGLSGPTVESRNGGVQIIEVDLGRTFTLADPAGISVIGRKTTTGVMGPPVSYTPESVTIPRSHVLRMTFAPAALPDQTCYSFSIGPTVTNEPLVGDLDVGVRSLYGDASGDGQVVLGDTLLVKSRINQSATQQPQCDVNLSGGSINLGDSLATKSQVTSPTHRALCP